MFLEIKVLVVLVLVDFDLIVLLFSIVLFTDAVLFAFVLGRGMPNLFAKYLKSSLISVVYIRSL